METLTDNLVIVKKRSIGNQYIYHSHYSYQTMAHNLIIHSDGFLDHNWMVHYKARVFQELLIGTDVLYE